jgi:subtilisin family serine protease
VKYLILRKHFSEPENPFTDLVSATGDEDPPTLPFVVEPEELSDHDVADLRRDPTIEDVVASIPFTLVEPVDQAAVDDATLNASWGIDAIGATECRYEGNDVRVCVLDTGIDKSHAAFRGIDFDALDLMDFTTSDQGAAGVASDESGHGTHVAATVFGRDVNGTRIGVARAVRKVLIGKVLGARGGSTEAIVNAIEWALKRRADIISMSLGINFPGMVTRLIAEDFPADIAASRALQAYRSNLRLFDRLFGFIDAQVECGRGALLVAAAGNESRRLQNPRFTVAVAPPAAADGIVSVGAVQRTEDASAPYAVAAFSNTQCFVCAPGVSIVSAQRGGGLVAMSGTSMATPHVAGVMAQWTQKLFPGSARPAGWANEVLHEVRHRARGLSGQIHGDVGRGLVQAPK